MGRIIPTLLFCLYYQITCNSKRCSDRKSDHKSQRTHVASIRGAEDAKGAM
jgi:hypothetical protein